MATEKLYERMEIRRARRPFRRALTTFPRLKSRSEFLAKDTASRPESKWPGEKERGFKGEFNVQVPKTLYSETTVTDWKETLSYCQIFTIQYIIV